jgi:hypothetical protein
MPELTTDPNMCQKSTSEAPEGADGPFPGSAEY